MTNPYKESGVDEPKEQNILADMLTHLTPTYANREGKHGEPHFSKDQFANVLKLPDDTGLAICTDGVGTKLLLAKTEEQIKNTAIDLIANNVNDLLCVGAEPIALVDYIGIDTADESVLMAIAKGLRLGADQAGISIPGGEIAQVAELLHRKHGATAYDLVATAVGITSLGAHHNTLPTILRPEYIQPGDVLVGIESSGLHSNGYTLARKVLNCDACLDSHDYELGRSIREELLIPSHIYVDQVLPLLKDNDLCIKGVANISGGGLLSVCRLNTNVSYEINHLMPCPLIFDMIQLEGHLDDVTMYQTFNMGIGMVLVCNSRSAGAVRAAIKASGRNAEIIGEVVEDKILPGRIYIPQLGLIGEGEEFVHTA